MFGTPETLRAQLLEHMPPLDAAAYAKSAAAAGTLTSSAAPAAMVRAAPDQAPPLTAPLHVRALWLLRPPTYALLGPASSQAALPLAA